MSTQTATQIPEITVRIPQPTPSDLSDNRNTIIAALQQMRKVQIRLNLDIYAPGTPDNPKARYYSLRGSSPTLFCSTPESVRHALNEIRSFVAGLNGWTTPVEKDKEATS